jgi:polygalacturonase
MATRGGPIVWIATLAIACSARGDDPAPDGPPGDVDDDVAADATEAPEASEPTCSARAHGAAGDGVSLDTSAIQAAIDECAAAGGGRATLDPGTYLSGPIQLKSGVTLALAPGATLINVEQDRDDLYGGPDDRVAAFVWANGADRIGIEGPPPKRAPADDEVGAGDQADAPGVIDGNGQSWWPRELLGMWRPRLVKLTDCRDVVIRDVTLRQSPKWTLHLVGSDRVTIERVRIRNTVGDGIVSPNTDGIDIETSRDVEVSHCDVETGDDAVCVKSSEKAWLRPTHGIDVHHCVVSGWANGFKIGTMPRDEVRDVTFRDSRVQASVESSPGTRVMGGITLISDYGADVHDIVAERIRMTAVRSPFLLRVQHRCIDGSDSTTCTEHSEAGRLRDITLRDVTVDDAQIPGLVLGVPDHRVESVRLEDVTIVSSKGGTAADRDADPGERDLEYPDAPYFGTCPAFGLFARHVAGPLVAAGTVSLSSSAPDARAAVVLHDVLSKDLSGLAPGAEVVDHDTAPGF